MSQDTVIEIRFGVRVEISRRFGLTFVGAFFRISRADPSGCTYTLSIDDTQIQSKVLHTFLCCWVGLGAPLTSSLPAQPLLA